jgi:magnesium and cobalt exporter, CNNM family
MSLLDAVGISFLLAANGFFVAAEFALISARRTQIEPLVRHGSRRARTVLAAMETVPTQLAGAQLGVTLASLALGALGEPTIAHALAPAFHAAGLPTDLLHPVSFTLALALVVTGHILLGEMVPKNLALAGPERSALWLVPPLYLFATALRPLLAAITALSTGVLRLVRIPPANHTQTVYTAAELPALIHESREHHLLDQPGHDLMIATLALRARPVSTVTTPLEHVIAVPAGATAADLQQHAARYRHSRFPVRDRCTGELCGYLHILDALPGRPADQPLRTRPLTRLPDHTSLADALAAMRSQRSQLAAVTDRSGTITGVATLADILTGLLGRDDPRG